MRFCGLLLSVLAVTSVCADNNYSVQFGYATFNLTVTATTPIKVISFDYGNNNFQLPGYGGITSENAKLTETALANGLYHYVITVNAPSTVTTATFSQVPLLTDSPPTKNMSFADYYGVFQHIMINEEAAQYQEDNHSKQMQNPVPTQVLGAYYADWSEYAGSGNFKPNLIPFTQLNTIYYAFGSLDYATGDAEMFDPYADAAMSGVNALPYIALQKQLYPYLNLIYSFGGWGDPDLGNYQSGDMSLLFSYYPQQIQNFATSLVNAVNKTGFNGIDIDYEWNAPQEPQPSGGHQPLQSVLTQAEADGYATLIYDLRHAANLPDNFNITIALPAGVDKINALAGFKYQGVIGSLKGQSDLQIIGDNIDHINLMTYDFHGGFDAGQQAPYNVSDFLAPMATAPSDPNAKDPTLTQYSIQGAVKALLAADTALKKSQIVIGVPAYGRLEQIAQSKPATTANRGVYLPLATDQSHAAGELGNSEVDYRCLMNATADCLSYKIPPDLIMVLAVNPTDPVSAAVETAWAYSVNANQFISFDSAATAQAKAAWIKANGYGGAMLWELDGDIWSSDADYAKDSLVVNVAQGLRAHPGMGTK